MLQQLDTSIPEDFRSDLAHAVRILREGGCSEVFVFGSVAANAARRGSDLDLAVHGCPKESFFALFGKLIMELEHPVDLVDLDQPSPFVRHLQRQELMLKVG